VIDTLRWAGPLVLAAVTALAVDQLTVARGLQPPGLARPGRRLAAALVLTFVFWVGVFLSLGQVGRPTVIDFESVETIQLFSLHALLVAALLAWFLLAFGGGSVPGRLLPRVWNRQLGLAARRPLAEIGIGLGLGLLVWPALLVLVSLVAAFLFLFGGERLLPAEPPPMIVWIAGLPVAVRLGIAASAGVVEELFFRGFLQPRVGIALSTLLFALAHLAYEQPFMLVGITVLSLVFAALVAWRQSVWAAMAAHFLFDAVQLLVVIPWALRQWGGGLPAGPVAGVL
jgi:membrane protease YdiL (CAAX protease family)